MPIKLTLGRSKSSLERCELLPKLNWSGQTIGKYHENLNKKVKGLEKMERTLEIRDLQEAIEVSLVRKQTN